MQLSQTDIQLIPGHIVQHPPNSEDAIVAYLAVDYQFSKLLTFLELVLNKQCRLSFSRREDHHHACIHCQFAVGTIEQCFDLRPVYLPLHNFMLQLLGYSTAQYCARCAVNPCLEELLVSAPPFFHIPPLWPGFLAKLGVSTVTISINLFLAAKLSKKQSV